MAEAARPRATRFTIRRGLGRLGHLLEGERTFGMFLVAPAVLYILLLVAYPFFIALQFAVTDATVSDPIGPFTGLENFLFVIQDDVFRRALLNTFVFTLSSEVMKAALGTGLAFLLLRQFRGRGIVRALIMVPFAIPIAVGAMAWRWMFDSTYSVINWAGVHLHLFTAPGPNWLGDPFWAMVAIVFVNVWRGLPFTAIIVLAGINAIPQEIVEAAHLDGANWWRRWNDIMVPIIAPVIFIAMLFSVVFTFTDMTVVWLLTQGNPLNSTHVLSSYAFVVGIISGGLGRGAVISLFLFPVLLIGALSVLRILKSRSMD